MARKERGEAEMAFTPAECYSWLLPVLLPDFPPRRRLSARKKKRQGEMGLGGPYKRGTKAPEALGTVSSHSPP
ncbi:hypothetical protein RR48_15485 [Papilio machaon]|uniref:Uncharacterized protein n=1 Tax=Papilio machaon TaxID=76193 RepID=A0A194QVJ4_PAPMA|nr:hypothetical protein RR48_15485 [Papilio machaon]